MQVPTLSDKHMTGVGHEQICPWDNVDGGDGHVLPRRVALHLLDCLASPGLRVRFASL